MSELFLIRHAQASFGSDNYDRLTEAGHRQAMVLGEYFNERRFEFDHFVCGTLQRHQQTLEGIVNHQPGNKPSTTLVLEGLNEYDFETLIPSYCRQYPHDVLVCAHRTAPADQKAYYRLLRQVLLAWSSDEIEDLSCSWHEFVERVRVAQGRVQQLASGNSRIVAVSSGGAISVFIGLVLGLAPAVMINLNLQMRNTGISHFFFNRSSMQLSSFNGVPHLDQPDLNLLMTYG